MNKGGKKTKHKRVFPAGKGGDNFSSLVLREEPDVAQLPTAGELTFWSGEF